MASIKPTVGVCVLLALASAQILARGVAPADLVGLTDVAAVTISPDGRFVAYHTHKAMVDSDNYQTRWWIVGLESKAPPVEVGDAGDPQLASGGYWDVRRPEWSPSNDQIAYVLRKGEEVQIWRSTVEGGVQEQLTHNAANVRDFVWSPDGQSLLFEVGPTRSALKAEATRRKEQGLLFEEVTSPWEGQPVIDPERTLKGIEIWVYELGARRERKALPTEAAEFERRMAPMRSVPSMQVQDDNSILTVAALSPDGKFVAAAQRGKPLGVFVDIRAVQGGQQARRFKFPSDFYAVRQLWWRPNGRELYFLQTDNNDRTEFYAMDVRNGRTRRISDSRDTLSECSFDAAKARAACIREDLTKPPEAAVIEMRDGAVRTLTDLNPAWRTLELSQPVRMDWVNTYGAAAFAHVLKPIGYVPGKRYPMIITSYRSRGFLRGGTGDEYPAQVFAANGFVVLSFDRPESYALTTPKTQQAPDTNILEYASPTSSLEIAVAKLTEQGLIDPQRVGGTGLSNGATTMCFALTHSNILGAAAVSNLNGDDPLFYYLSAERHRRQWRMSGFGGLPDQGPNADRWREASPALNATHVTAPILVNAPAEEYLIALQFYHSLRELNKPVELMIYPGEGHIKKQPRHRYFIYQRNLDWFNFWFQNRERDQPLTDVAESPQALQAQYVRWRKFREMKAAQP